MIALIPAAWLQSVEVRLAPQPGRVLETKTEIIRTQAASGAAEGVARVRLAVTRRWRIESEAEGYVRVEMEPVSAAAEAIEGEASPPAASVQEVMAGLKAKLLAKPTGEVVEIAPDGLIPTPQRDSIARAALAEAGRLGPFGFRLPEGPIGPGAEWTAPLGLPDLPQITEGQVKPGAGALRARHAFEGLEGGLMRIRVHAEGRQDLELSFAGLAAKGWVELSGSSVYWVEPATGAALRAEFGQEWKASFGLFQMEESIAGSMTAAWLPGQPDAAARRP